jgi:parvulin-like peptidyl-prolyl isomerase
MAKSKAQVARPQVRHRRRPADSEHITRLLILGGVISVILIAGGVIAFGWYQTHVKPLNKTVLQVGSMNYSLGHLERRMKDLKGRSSFYTQSNATAQQLPDDALTQLEREAKMLQGSSELHVSVSDEEFATEIKSRGNVAADAKPDVYAASYKEQVKASGLKQHEFELMVRADLLQTKLADYFKFVAAPSEAQIKANYLVADTQEKAQQAYTRISNGEDFKTVADQIVTSQANGNIDWMPRGGSALLSDAVETFLFDTAKPGEISQPMQTGALYYVTQLLDRDPNRALDDQGRQRVARRDLVKWIDGLTLTSVQHFSDADRNRALNAVY